MWWPMTMLVCETVASDVYRHVCWQKEVGEACRTPPAASAIKYQDDALFYVSIEPYSRKCSSN